MKIVVVEKDSQTDNITISLEGLEKLIEAAKEEGRQEVIKEYKYENIPYWLRPDYKPSITCKDVYW